MNDQELVVERRRSTDDLAIEASSDDRKEEPPKRGRESILAKTRKFLGEKIKVALTEKGVAKIAIFTHPSPDPDAIGSQMGLTWLLRKAYDGVELDCF